MRTIPAHYKRYIPFIFGAVLLTGLVLTSTYHYLLFHSLAEIFTIIIAGNLFVLVWNTRRHMDDDYLLFVGIAYLFASILDLVHTLAYEGMGIFPQYGPNLAPQLWIAARYLQSLSLLAAPLVIGRRIRTAPVMAGYAAVVSLALTAIFYWRTFPVCFIPGVGLTPFKVISEYIITFILIAALGFTFVRRRALNQGMLTLLFGSIVLTIATEMAFTFYVRMYGLSNLVGHLFRICSFYLLYKAIAETGLQKPFDLMFHDLKNGEAALMRANATLEQRVEERTAELVHSEKQIKLLLDAAGEGIFGIRSDGNVTFINPAAASMFGFTAEEMVGACMHDVTHHTRADGTPYPHEECPVYAAFHDGQTHRIDDEVFWRKDGSPFPVEYITTPIYGGSGEITGAVVTFTDITKRKQAERDRIARTAAEEASRAKSEFVANMSHEIRTPMNAIIGFAQMLERDPSLTARQADHVRIIMRSGSHLLLLINDILDMSKIEAGRISLNETVFPLHSLLDDLELMFSSRADAKGLRFLVEREKGVPRYASADEGKLRQVLINLLGNAVKFTETGEVAMRVRTEAIAGESLDDKAAFRLVVEVEDSGPGIAPEETGLIFDAFHQTAAGVKAGGTGLGLAISGSFVEMMHGNISVTSEEGKGSCFRLELPLTPAENAVEKAGPAARNVVGLEPGAGPFRILVVDDGADNRSLMRELLRTVGFEVAEAVNGVEALEVFQRWSPHVVIMDMRMPVMDGYEATRRIKATAEGRATPVIAVTASAFVDDYERVMASGMYAYLRKPFNPDDLFEILGKCLNLRFVFADDAAQKPGHPHGDSSTRELPIAALPQDMIEAMRSAVAEGNMARLAELIAGAAKIDNDLAQGLQALADEYEYEKLDQWLTKGAAGNG